MKPRLKSTSAARELIKAYVPFSANAHQNGDGSWVVGYGHHAAAKAGVSVTPEEAELLLVYDVLQAEQAIDESIGGEIGTPQRDALVSFALGIGLAAFRRSAVVRLIRKQRWHEAADAIAAWNGGGEARHEAERELFLKDLPEDANRTPVELIIEFDHPSDELDVSPVVKTDAGPEPEVEPDISSEEVAEAAEEAPAPEAPPPAPETPEPVRKMPGRSELAERVILRMRSQLSGPVRESGYAPVPLAEGGTAESPDAESVAAIHPGALGFAYTQSVAIDDENDPVAADDAPPIVGVNSASADGASGEVSGAGDASAAMPSREEEDEPLTPSDIDAEFAEEADDSKAVNGWSNGDSAPAPGGNGGHLGEIILLVLGVALLGGGIWDLSSRIGVDAPQSSLFYGLSAVVAGFIFAAGAAIWLFGSKKK
ncbi:MAG: glycoside hydrolase family protein [Alphaproteobacteria bacterium]|nr:glycoside hydrolase family protein [Alphaproteobacteria bacterium]